MRVTCEVRRALRRSARTSPAPAVGVMLARFSTGCTGTWARAGTWTAHRGVAPFVICWCVRPSRGGCLCHWQRGGRARCVRMRIRARAGGTLHFERDRSVRGRRDLRHVHRQHVRAARRACRLQGLLRRCGADERRAQHAGEHHSVCGRSGLPCRLGRASALHFLESADVALRVLGVGDDAIG